ncbi:MAG TPA: hypothetical protein VFG72_11690 [Marmoricola sp.]|nr:hypothetical protein [Marmoricola sp.]
MRPHTKKKVGLVTLATVAITSSLAYAYWTAEGSGTGSADTADGTLALTVHQTSVVADMGPGVVAQVLTGNFDNPNSGPVYVGTVTASIASVTKASGAPAGTCDASDYTLAGAAMTVDAEVPVGTGVGTWTGATIKFNNKNVNQDACKGATVNLAYTIS